MPHGSLPVCHQSLQGTFRLVLGLPPPLFLTQSGGGEEWASLLHLVREVNISIQDTTYRTRDPLLPTCHPNLTFAINTHLGKSQSTLVHLQLCGHTSHKGLCFDRLRTTGSHTPGQKPKLQDLILRSRSLRRLKSPAAVERLFSQGSDIMKPIRASLTSENFERLTFMKDNMDLLNTELPPLLLED
ncbi:hypothetical protein O3P69_005785 [Scylla paramamosain]|uniref:HAT C-terminal dimerisation domain-containing protein n=1 Tax=Scylla paramamosain TaxID=85552 RepID=A0AAW0U719_SCYPA